MKPDALLLFDDAQYVQLLPFTYTRPIAEIRLGILTLREKWEIRLNLPAATLCREPLSLSFPAHFGSDNLLLNARWLADKDAADLVLGLKKGQRLLWGNTILAARTEGFDMASPELKDADLPHAPILLNHLWEIFSLNKKELAADFELLTQGKKSAPISATNQIHGAYPVFAEPGAQASCSVFNTTDGPVYLAENSEVMEGCLIRGGLALGRGSVLKMGAKVYGATTLGPECKVGGELNNVVFFGYSNKAHDGFLGNSVIGQWCNLGADSNNSNLKNNYAPVKLWNYATKRMENTGLQFCGLFMGDHSKCGINTMFNTGTVVGVSANIFGSGFPRNFIPSFSWGGAQGFIEFKIDKALEVAEAMMGRRGLPLSESDRAILATVYEETAPFRAGYK